MGDGSDGETFVLGFEGFFFMMLCVDSDTLLTKEKKKARPDQKYIRESI